MTIPDILRALDGQIAQLQQARQLLSDAENTDSSSTEPAKRRGRPPSPVKKEAGAGSEADSERGRQSPHRRQQKKRWAKSNKAAKAAAPIVTTKKDVAAATKKGAAAPAKKAPSKKATVPVSKITPAKGIPAPPKKATAKKAASPAGKTPHPIEDETVLDAATSASVGEVLAEA